MEVRNTTLNELENALAEVNKKYDGNIRFRHDPEFIGRTRQRGEKYKVRLTIKNSRGPGTKIGPSGRRVATACWHVHGEFMDALPETALIVVSWIGGKKQIRPGDFWDDWMEGALFTGYSMASELCECD